MLFVTCSIAIALDVTVQQFKESPGLYYDRIEQAQLYNTEWKVVTYIHLELIILELLEIMHKCPLIFAKNMNINFGLITLVV